MKVLVTGSSGHLGEALMRTLRNRSIEAIGIDISPGTHTNRIGSIIDADFIRSCLEGVTAVLHTATLHKPHVATHDYQEFIDTNITGTLNLLQESAGAEVTSFIYTSTTSTFGDLLTPAINEPAVWITEESRCIPKNIYGVTKAGAEDICQLFFRNHQLPCIVLKTSRFFPEEDDDKKVRDKYDDDNSKANEMLYRRVDIEDVVSAHLLAMDKATSIGFGKYIISATAPFTKHDMVLLRNNATEVVEKYFPGFQRLYEKRNWKMLPGLDRVYVNAKARLELGWKPVYDFAYVLECLKNGKDLQSELARQIGKKGYHPEGI